MKTIDEIYQSSSTSVFDHADYLNPLEAFKTSGRDFILCLSLAKHQSFNPMIINAVSQFSKAVTTSGALSERDSELKNRTVHHKYLTVDL